MPKATGNERTRFQPGQSGNPSGRPKLERELEKLRRLNLQEFSEWFQKLWRCDPNEIEKLLANEGNPIFVHILGGILLEVKEKRKPQDLACLLPYIVGKPKDTLQHELPEPTIIHLGGDRQLILATKKPEEK